MVLTNEASPPVSGLRIGLLASATLLVRASIISMSKYGGPQLGQPDEVIEKRLPSETCSTPLRLNGHRLPQAIILRQLSGVVAELVERPPQVPAPAVFDDLRLSAVIVDDRDAARRHGFDSRDSKVLGLERIRLFVAAVSSRMPVDLCSREELPQVSSGDVRRHLCAAVSGNPPDLVEVVVIRRMIAQPTDAVITPLLQRRSFQVAEGAHHLDLSFRVGNGRETSHAQQQVRFGHRIEEGVDWWIKNVGFDSPPGPRPLSGVLRIRESVLVAAKSFVPEPAVIQILDFLLQQPVAGRGNRNPRPHAHTIVKGKEREQHPGGGMTKGRQAVSRSDEQIVWATEVGLPIELSEIPPVQVPQTRWDAQIGRLLAIDQAQANVRQLES